MNRKSIILISMILISLAGCSNPEVKMVWSVDNQLKVPESVMYDSARDILYVANINGKPTEKNNKGFISTVTTDGKVQTLNWIKGLNAPKGMGIAGDRLYVTDIDRIHIIDIPGSKIIKTINVNGAQFLNDIAVDKNGNVYVTDMSAKKVNILSDGTIRTWVDLKEYNKPNGLYMEKNDLMVGTADGLLRVNIKSKKIIMEIPHKGGIDGLKSDGKGSYIVSDWKGKTQLINKSKKAVVLMDTSKDKINAADLEFIPEKNLILIPTFFNNRVVAYKLNN